jgi:Fe2+ or Zn2+ uptake regulation protein
MSKSLYETIQKTSLKVTPARVAVLRAFTRKLQPLSAETLIHKLRKADVDNVTIYRTLNIFEKVGIIRRVDLRKDSICFELASHHHHHFVCTGCGDIEKINKCNLQSLVKKSLRQAKKFASVDTHSFELFGLCKICAEN